MSKYACIQKFYDSGKVTAIVEPVDDDYAVDRHQSLSKYDLYIDVFESRKEADTWRKQALKA